MEIQCQAMCKRSNINIKEISGSRRFNPAMSFKKLEDFFSVRILQRQFDEPQAGWKTEGDYSHEDCHRIAGDATEFGRKQKVNLWELSHRCCRHPSETFLWQIIFSKDWSNPGSFHFQSWLFAKRQSELREQINQSFRLHRLDHRCILPFFLVSSIWLLHQL